MAEKPYRSFSKPEHGQPLCVGLVFMRQRIVLLAHLDQSMGPIISQYTVALSTAQPLEARRPDSLAKLRGAGGEYRRRPRGCHGGRCPLGLSGGLKTYRVKSAAKRSPPRRRRLACAS